MPYFEHIRTIDICPDEYLDACSPSEIQEVIQYLTDYHGDIHPSEVNANSECGLIDDNWNTIINVLSNSRLQLTAEETQQILNIAKRIDCSVYL